jgi:hypothetical protein
MPDPQDAMERLARLDDELGIQPKPPEDPDLLAGEALDELRGRSSDLTFKALVEYDKLQIVFSQLMEYWLEGRQPPASLVNIYYDQLTNVQCVCSNAKIFERVNRETADFYDKINSQYPLDNTPNLF